MRKTLMLSALLSAAVLATQAQAALKPGDVAPQFKLMTASNGQLTAFDLKSALAKGPVVVYFYPKSFTSGCSLEAHQFSEAMTQFQALHVTVVGISADDIVTQQRFSMADCQGKFPVASDASAEVATKYDAKIPALDMAARVSYLIGQDGKIAFVHSDMKADGHVSALLAAAKALKP
jgi:thioredoxin-dependent peroxiredoxin